MQASRIGATDQSRGPDARRRDEGATRSLKVQTQRRRGESKARVHAAQAARKRNLSDQESPMRAVILIGLRIARVFTLAVYVRLT